jgi:CubicO group peptidase (beta-lactamase class C family)
MKKLTETEKILNKMLTDKTFTSYALLVGFGADEWEFMSDDVNLDTYFDLASVGKVFPTSTLALKAIDRGLLSLDDTLEKFFDNVTEDKKNITVKQLLTHTSGILRYPFPDNVAERGRESISEFIFSTPLAYEPGTKYAYCCSGIILLAFIVEKVYGMTMNEAFEKYLCKPLGLTRSQYDIALDEPNAVICHHNPEVFDCRRDDNNGVRMGNIPCGSGGDFGTAGDLRKFVKAVMNMDERLYSKETFRIAEQNYTKGLEVLDLKRGAENHALGYTYVNENCIQARDLFPDGSIGHDGWSGQSFYLNRELGLYVILLTNATRCTAIKYGETDDDVVYGMRVEIHKAIKADLGI